MSNESHAAVVKVTRSINVFERNGITLLEEQHALIGNILAARRTIIAERGKANLSPSFGLEAIETAAQAQSTMSTAMRLVADCHRHLAADRELTGVTVTGLGDVWPCPTGTLSDQDARPALKVVA